MMDMLASMNADFLLTSIPENFTRICNSSGPRFLRPRTHLIFILVKPITTKDVTLHKRGRSNMHQMDASCKITRIILSFPKAEARSI